MKNKQFLSDVPMSWDKVRLKNLVEVKITDGPHETPQLVEEGIPFISAEAIKNNKVNFDKKRGNITYNLHEKYSRKCSPQRNDILIIKSGATTGNSAIVETDEVFDIWSPLALVRADTKKVLPYFLFYVISSKLFRNQIEISWSFGTQQNIGMKVIENLYIPLPSIAVQKQAVLYLDFKLADIDNLISSKEKQIQLLEEQRQAMITEAVTKGLSSNVKMKNSGIDWIGEVPDHWQVKKIKFLSNVKRGASPRPIDDPKYYSESGKYSWVRISDVTKSGKYLVETKDRLSSLGASKSVKRYKGDLFLSIAGTVGKACITQINCCIHDGFVYFDNLKIKEELLYYIFESGQCYKGLGKFGTQLNLNTDTVGNIVIPVCTQNESEDILVYLQTKDLEYRELIRQVELQLVKINEYRQSLIHEVVTGKIPIEEMEKYLWEVEDGGN